MAKNKKEKEVQKTAAIPPIDAKRAGVASGGGSVAVGGIINQRITNSPPNQSGITANINGKRELQKLPLLMETAPGNELVNATVLALVGNCPLIQSRMESRSAFQLSEISTLFPHISDEKK